MVIELATTGVEQSIREVAGMRSSDVTQAFWIVEEHAELLLDRWREIHG